MTREEAIKHIITYAYFEDDIPLQVATALDMAISALRAQQEQESKPLNGWISVKDRLPEKDENYIVTACDEGCSAGEGIWYSTVVVVAEYYKGSWTWYEGGSEYSLEGIVTHWMPLPNPPKGEERKDGDCNV